MNKLPLHITSPRLRVERARAIDIQNGDPGNAQHTGWNFLRKETQIESLDWCLHALRQQML